MAAWLLDSVVTGAGDQLCLRFEEGQVARADLEPLRASAVVRAASGLEHVASLRRVVDGGPSDEPKALPDPRLVGCVPAGDSLFPHLTVRENIGYGLVQLGDSQAVTDDRIARIAGLLQLGPVLDEKPYAALSAARRFTVAVARSAACLPDVLVIDLPANPMEPDRLATTLKAAASAGADGGHPMAVVVLSQDEGVTRAISKPVEVRTGPCPDGQPAGGPS